MALLHRPVHRPGRARVVSRETSSPWPGLGLAVAGAFVAWCVHRLVPAVPMLTAAVVLGIAIAHLRGYGPSYEAPRGRASPWRGGG